MKLHSQRPSSTVLRIAGIVAACLLVTPQAAATAFVCEYLGFSEASVGLGEARYTINASSTDAYTNAYYDGGDELTTGSTDPVGWADATASYDVGFTSVIEDVSGSNCGNVTIELAVYNKASGSCAASGTSLMIAQHKVNTCTVGGSYNVGDYYFNNRFRFNQMTGPGSFFYQIRVYDLELAPSTIRSTDTGCYRVPSSATLCL